MNKLKVGDIIFSRGYGEIRHYGKIDRVTEKFAFANNSKFNIDYSERSVSISPRQTYGSTFYFVPTEDEIIELKKQNLIRFVVKFDYSTLDFDKICEIIDIIKRR